MIWTEETVCFLRRAYEHGGANRMLAGMIGPKLTKGAHVCDAGCGLGYLSLELVRYAQHVTAVDISALALDTLRERCRRDQIEGITPVCTDARTMKPAEPYDAMVFCFFGGLADALRMAKAQCRGDVFYISRNYDRHRFSAGSHSVTYSGYRDARQMLDRLRIPYEWTEFEMDVGQPFADLGEARRFFALYSRDDSALLTDEFILSRLHRTQRKDFPLYMPHMRKAGMVHFSVMDIPMTGVE